MLQLCRRAVFDRTVSLIVFLTAAYNLPKATMTAPTLDIHVQISSSPSSSSSSSFGQHCRPPEQQSMLEHSVCACCSNYSNQWQETMVNLDNKCYFDILHVPVAASELLQYNYKIQKEQKESSLYGCSIHTCIQT